MENVQDSNHVPFIHPKTLFPVMASPVRIMKGEPEAAPSKLVSLLQQGQVPDLNSLSYPAQTPVSLNRSWFADLCQVYRDENIYYSWYLYPNVNFCSVRGEYFLLQQYDPVSPGETDYHLWIMTARRKNERTDFTALLSILIRKERAVIAEDSRVLERLQEGLGNHSRPFAHGDYEAHLVRQHLWYRAQLAGEI